MFLLLLLLVLPNYFLKNGKCDLFLIGENFFKNAFIVGVHSGLLCGAWSRVVVQASHQFDDKWVSI